MRNIKELIRREIERRKNKAETMRERGAYLELLSFLDTLEEPVTDCYDLKNVSEDLEEAARDFVGFDMDRDELYEYEIGIAAFKAGAEWQKRKMMEGAVEGFIFQSEDYYPKQLIAGYYGELGMGDKVKIIIVKEGEQ